MKVKEILADPRRRVIFTTILAAVVLFVLCVILLINFINRSQSQTTTSAEISDVAITTPIEDNKLEPVDNSNNAGIVTVMPSETTEAKKESSASSIVVTPATTKTNLPQTGPESLLPLALIAGATTALLVSRRKSVL